MRSLAQQPDAIDAFLSQLSDAVRPEADRELQARPAVACIAFGAARPRSLTHGSHAWARAPQGLQQLKAAGAAAHGVPPWDVEFLMARARAEAKGPHKLHE